jgi:VIT1/CCC1 family predicted Fe2+/Mn2+ transporter
MASGEWVSVKSQTELLQRELEVEREALATSPDDERRELRELYESKGLSHGLAAQMADEVMANPTLALEVHAREELGIDPHALGNPWLVAGASFLLFAVGAFLPLIPWLVASGASAVWWSIGLGLAGAAVLGGTVSTMSGKSVPVGALRQVLITSVAALVTTGIGALVGAG